MFKQSVVTGLAIVLFGLLMAQDANAKFPWPFPSEPCTSSNYGAYASRVIYVSNGGNPYRDTATYICYSAGWELADVTRCFVRSGYCVPL
jgi:hypothetical protein